MSAVNLRISREGGTRVMCEVMEKYTTEARNEGWTKGRAEGRVEGKTEANIDAVVNMLKLGIDESSVKECYPNEFEEGKKRFLKEEN